VITEHTALVDIVRTSKKHKELIFKIFNHRGGGCFTCNPVAFRTIKEACEDHQLNLGEVLDEIQKITY